MNKPVKKAIGVFLIFLAGVSLYGAVIVLANQYLRKHDMLTPYAELALLAFLVAGFCIAYRWLSRKLDKLGKEA